MIECSSKKIKELSEIFDRIQRERLNDSMTYNRVAVAKFDGMGDFVLFLDFASHLRSFYHGSRIVLFTAPNNEYFAVQSGYFDEVLTISTTSMNEENILNTYKTSICKYRFDLLLNPTGPRHFNSELLCALIYAKKKIAAKYECADMPTPFHKYLSRIYDEEIDNGQWNMMLVQNAEFARGLGFTEMRAAVPTLRCSQRPPLITGDYCIIFIGGSFRRKCWNINKMAFVMRHIINVIKIKCVLCGVDEDCADAAYLQSIFGCDVIDMTGKTDLDELMNLIIYGKFFLGNDTSAAHIATALGIPAIVISGQFAAERFFPYVIETGELSVLPIEIKAVFACAGCSFDYRKSFACVKNSQNSILPCVDSVSEYSVIKAIDKYIIGK